MPKSSASNNNHIYPTGPHKNTNRNVYLICNAMDSLYSTACMLKVNFVSEQ